MYHHSSPAPRGKTEKIGMFFMSHRVQSFVFGVRGDRISVCFFEGERGSFIFYYLIEGRIV